MGRMRKKNRGKEKRKMEEEKGAQRTPPPNDLQHPPLFCIVRYSHKNDPLI